MNKFAIIFAITVMALAHAECEYSFLNTPVPPEQSCGCSPDQEGCKSFCVRDPNTMFGKCTCPYFYTAPLVTENSYTTSQGRMFTSDNQQTPVINPATNDINFTDNDACPMCAHPAPIHNYKRKR